MTIIVGSYFLLWKIHHFYPRFSAFSGLRNLTSNNMDPIKTFVFLDLETTGLPHLEHNLTRITEFCAVAVQADHIELGCFPRVHNKLSFCVNPQRMIDPEGARLTGLSNDLLERQPCFSSGTVDVIKKWLDMFQKPVCFVAHNGSRFDYPILRAEIDRTKNSLPEDILCIDSIAAFRHIDRNKDVVIEKPKAVPFEFDDGFDEILSQACEEFERDQVRGLTPQEMQKKNETTPKKQIISSQTQSHKNNRPIAPSKKNHFREFVSYKLGDVYTRLTSKQPSHAHEAEGDVAMMITCAATYGEKFVAYANEFPVIFSDTPIMKPGKRIGT